MHLIDEIHNLPTTSRDLASLFLGRKLGDGMSRNVYICEQDKTCVVKQEFGGTNFQNVMEWKIWEAIQGTPMAKWFAPCLDISPNGILLIQKRCEPLQKKDYPKKLPHFFTDTKHQNYGMLGKQFVCFDYGTVAFSNYFISKRFKKVDWTDYDN